LNPQSEAAVRGLPGAVASVVAAEGLANGQESSFSRVRSLQQLATVRDAVNGLLAQVLEGHLRQHLTPRAGIDLEALTSILQRYLH